MPVTIGVLVPIFTVMASWLPLGRRFSLTLSDVTYGSVEIPEDTFPSYGSHHFCHCLSPIFVEMSEEQLSPGAAVQTETRQRTDSVVESESEHTQSSQQNHTSLQPVQLAHSSHYPNQQPESVRNEHLLPAPEVADFFNNLDTKTGQPVLGTTVMTAYDEMAANPNLASLSNAQVSYPKASPYSNADFYKTNNMFVPTSTPILPSHHYTVNRLVISIICGIRAPYAILVRWPLP